LRALFTGYRPSVEIPSAVARSSTLQGCNVTTLQIRQSTLQGCNKHVATVQRIPIPTYYPDLLIPISPPMLLRRIDTPKGM
jgi:hypothetical protein